jgi:hypothetical protein
MTYKHFYCLELLSQLILEIMFGLRQLKYSVMFSFRNFKAVAYKFEPMIHFKLIFVFKVKIQVVISFGY